MPFCDKPGSNLLNTCLMNYSAGFCFCVLAAFFNIRKSLGCGGLVIGNVSGFFSRSEQLPQQRFLRPVLPLLPFRL